jgi:hypothetical protein
MAYYKKRAGGLISRKELLDDIHHSVRFTCKTGDFSEIRGAEKIIDRIKAALEMDIERALNNAIVSAEMEGFELSEKDRELLLKFLKKELGLDEVIEIKNKEFKNG